MSKDVGKNTKRISSSYGHIIKDYFRMLRIFEMLAMSSLNYNFIVNKIMQMSHRDVPFFSNIKNATGRP